MGSCGPVGRGGEWIANSCGTAVTQNEKTQEMDHNQTRPWTAPLRRPQGHHGAREVRRPGSVKLDLRDALMCGSQAGNGPQNRLGLEGLDVGKVSMAEQRNE